MKILIVDDNRQITSILDNYARKDGYETVIALDGADALEKFRVEKPDMLLLDVMMPKKDGFEVCKEIRAASNVPIIMITARGEDFERIMGLETGADDYIVKPFSAAEVMARVKAIMRRVRREGKTNVFVCADLTISLDDYKVLVSGEDISLTKKEVELLWTLSSGRNRVFSRNELLDELWGHDYYGDSRTVDSHIKRLRAKLDEYPHPAWDIRTIWGVGYKFEITANELENNQIKLSE